MVSFFIVVSGAHMNYQNKSKPINGPIELLTVPCNEKFNNTCVYLRVHAGIHATFANTTHRHG